MIRVVTNDVHYWSSIPVLQVGNAVVLHPLDAVQSSVHAGRRRVLHVGRNCVYCFCRDCCGMVNVRRRRVLQILHASSYWAVVDLAWVVSFVLGQSLQLQCRFLTRYESSDRSSLQKHCKP